MCILCFNYYIVRNDTILFSTNLSILYILIQGDFKQLLFEGPTRQETISKITKELINHWSRLTREWRLS